MTTNDKKVRVLCVEEDPQMRALLLAQFKARGFQTQAVCDGAQAIDFAVMFQPHLVLLDLTLPSLNGLTFLRRLREWSNTPVIILSTHDEEAVKIRALDLGADDYLTKPFSINELLARVRVSLRRSNEAQRFLIAVPIKEKTHYKSGGEHGLIVDYGRRIVQSGGKEVHLTPLEYNLLCVLTQYAGKILTHKELLQRVWGPDYSGEKTYLRTFMRHLRQKLEPDPAQPRFLRNEIGVGYFVPPPDIEDNEDLNRLP